MNCSRSVNLSSTYYGIERSHKGTTTHIETFLCHPDKHQRDKKKYNRENWKSKFEMCSNSRLVNNTTNDSNCVYILKGGKI